MYFANRFEAGHRLAFQLQEFCGPGTVVLGLTHGGVPVAYEIATALDAPLDVLVVRKLSAPFQPELAVGAVAPGAVYHDRQTAQMLRLTPTYLERLSKRGAAELAREEAYYRQQHQRVGVTGKTVIIVDDGIATGASVFAAIQSVRARDPRQIIIATPVCSVQAARDLAAEADHVVYLDAPRDFCAVGMYYEDFTQVTDEEVQALLKRSRLEREAHLKHEVSS